jgi:lysophospholipid acyltransferase (LPLAT)-like uncharacterized protein
VCLRVVLASATSSVLASATSSVLASATWSITRVRQPFAKAEAMVKADPSEAMVEADPSEASAKGCCVKGLP